MKRTLIFLMLLLFALPQGLRAQADNGLQGKVSCKKTGEAVMFAAVNIKERELWTTTDEEGNFSFRSVPDGSYTLQVSCLGYALYSQVFVVEKGKNRNLDIRISPQSFDMEEVNVLAKKNTDIATTTDISNAAIEHVQPTTLGDVMQLLPGSVAQNPDLSGPQQMAIREIGADNNSANGTAIIVDGAPISNDANLQSFSTVNLGEEKFNTVVGSGVDLRSISTDNIESVEIIKGIPSVVYGNLTSGAVVVKTKAGQTPFELKLKTDPRIKQVAMNKGFKLKKDQSFLNLDLDYLQSFTDLTSKYKGYDRLTGDIGYSKVFFQKKKIPLSLNAKLSYYGTLDDEKTDPDAFVAEEYYSNRENGTRFSLDGRWGLNKRLITNLKYTFSVSYSKQLSYQKEFRTTGGNVESISFALTEGENTGIFLPVEDTTELTIEGKPLSIFGQVSAEVNKAYSNGLINKIIYGFEYNRNQNLGKGQIYDITNPPVISSKSTRPRAFNDIPPLQNYSLFLEDKVKIPIRKSSLTIQAGSRLNNFQSDGLFGSELGFFLEPRLNARLEILNRDNNTLFKSLSLSGGAGKTYKSPSLYNLYPDKVYFDLPVLNYVQTYTAIFYTYISETNNPDLKPSENTKYELSLDFELDRVNGNITAFYEKLDKGFSFNTRYQYMDFYFYDISGLAEGEVPDPATLPKIPATYILGYSYPVNNQSSVKQGVEYSFDLGEIKRLYTSFRLDGAWLRTTRIYSTSDYASLPNSQAAAQFGRIGIYPAGESRVNERLNSNLRMVTHIPSLRMIVSTTLQMIWYDKFVYPYYDESPIYLIDRYGNELSFEEVLAADPSYEKFIIRKSDTYWLPEVTPLVWMASIRLSKEIGDKAKLSFYVNNFLNYRPMVYSVRTQISTRQNEAIYFGAELKIKI
ncbi:MAG: TonB-dependent receptor [Bacteroidota bacterium]